jgi:hypothetical protein
MDCLPQIGAPSIQWELGPQVLDEDIRWKPMGGGEGQHLDDRGGGSVRHRWRGQLAIVDGDREAAEQ